MTIARNILFILSVIMLMCSCYNNKDKQHDALTEPDASLSIEQLDSVALTRLQDSISFTSNHHYTRNYNFIVNTDSLSLITQQPEEVVSMSQTTPDQIENFDIDSIHVYYNEQLVVAEIRILPTDSVDSVWVQVARDQDTFGWIHESELLPNVVPDDPISQFISLFSNKHILWMLITVGVIIVLYVLRIIRRKRAKIVHFNDISSFYPTCLVLTVSVAATLYSSIVLLEPEMWRHFYYHPTLNPFAVPALLGVFLALVWLLPVVCFATIDDVSRHLPIEDALLYLAGLAAICMVDYVIFSVATLYYIGYPLLVAYFYFSVKTFNRYRRLMYYCGKCGKALSKKGKCKYCGAVNV